MITDTDESKAKQFVAPKVCWRKDRVNSDLKLSFELMKKLDVEKEINQNPTLLVAIDSTTNYSLDMLTSV